MTNISNISNTNTFVLYRYNTHTQNYTHSDTTKNAGKFLYTKLTATFY